MRDHGRAVRTRVGGTIQQLRLLRGWSQERLAERAGSSTKNIGRVERGEVSVGLDGLAEIAAALSVTIADLVVEPRGRRSARGAIHVIALTREELAHFEHAGAIARRITAPHARPSTRPSR